MKVRCITHLSVIIMFYRGVVGRRAHGATRPDSLQNISLSMFIMEVVYKPAPSNQYSLLIQQHLPLPPDWQRQGSLIGLQAAPGTFSRPVPAGAQSAGSMERPYT